MVPANLTTDLVRIHTAELLAAAERTRTTRRATGSRPLASRWRRRRDGRAGPPQLVLIKPAPARALPAPHTAPEGSEAA